MLMKTCQDESDPIRPLCSWKWVFTRQTSFKTNIHFRIKPLYIRPLPLSFLFPPTSLSIYPCLFFFFRICYILWNEIEGSALIFLVVISQLISWNLIWRKMGSDYCITSILHRISVEVFFYRCVGSLQQNQSKIWCESLT